MAPKYLQYFPNPLLDDLVKGRWLPVVGAGMSINAKVPAGKSVPLWSELGKTLELDLGDFTSSGPLDAISAFEHEFGRPRLIERLSEALLLGEAMPGEAHVQFCSIPFDLVCTTNFDFLLERQYDSTPRYVYPVVDEDQLSLNIAPEGTLLLKLHGDLRHPSRLVVTENDYDRFLINYPLIATFVANLLITKTAVLIGYSLDDPDFRQVWQVVTQRLGRTRRQAYAIAVGAKPADVARFARRGVTVINLPGTREKYGEVLATTFKELAIHWRDNVLGVSTVTEEEPLRELLLPKDASARLCFFAVPLNRITFYKERVFPAIDSMGLVPVTAGDVISPGDSIIAKIDALMDRAVAIVVEVGTKWTEAELTMALSRVKSAARIQDGRPPPRVVVVSSIHEPVPTPIDLENVFVINVDWTSEFDDGPRQIIDNLKQVIRDNNWQIAEPRRLLDSKEYRAAVIAAMTLLEVTLRRKLDMPRSYRSDRPRTIRGLVLEAKSREIIWPADERNILKWMDTRNKVVHENRPVTRQNAKEIVDGVYRLVSQ